MPLWGNTNLSNNAPKFLQGGHGGQSSQDVAEAANVAVAFANVVWGVPVSEVESTHKAANPGWQLVTFGKGPITAASANAAGSGYANGETITVTGGASPATLKISTNASGNVSSLTIVTGGLFTNAAQTSAAFNHEQHLSTIVIGAGGTGYANTDTIAVSNGVVNASATLTTNATGGITAYSITSVGLFANTAANASLVFSIANSTGGASAGSGATLTGTLATGTGATLNPFTLGGRANRVHYETIVAMRSLAANGAGGEFTNLP